MKNLVWILLVTSFATAHAAEITYSCFKQYRGPDISQDAFEALPKDIKVSYQGNLTTLSDTKATITKHMGAFRNTDLDATISADQSDDREFSNFRIHAKDGEGTLDIELQHGNCYDVTAWTDVGSCSDTLYVSTAGPDSLKGNFTSHTPYKCSLVQ